MKFNFDLRAVKNNKFINAVAILASATAVSQAIIILASPIITRIYSPSELGSFAVFAALAGVLSIISCLRYEFAIPLPSLSSQARLVMSAAFSLNFVTSMIVACFGVGVYAVLSGPPGDLWFYLLLPLSVYFAGVIKVCNSWCVREKLFRSIAKAKLYQNSVVVLLQILLGLVFGGWAGLIVGHVIGVGVAALIIFSVVGVNKTFLFRAFKSANVAKQLVILKRHKRFPCFDAPAAVFNALGNEMPKLLLAWLFEPAIAGFYFLAYRILGGPLTLIGQSISHVLYGDSRESLKNGSAYVLLIRIVGVLVLMVSVPAATIFFYGEPLFSFVFGEDWGVAGEIAAVLILSISFQFVYSPISTMLLSTGGQHINFALQFTMFSLRAVGMLIAWRYQDAMLAIYIFSLVGMVGYIVGIVVILVRVKKFCANVKVG